MQSKWLSSVVSASLLLAGVGCGRGLENPDEVAQSASEALASFEEAGQGGAFAMRLDQAPALLREGTLEKALGWVLPEAHAASCFIGNPFSACSAGVRTRTFSDCTFGRTTLQGSVTLTFSDQACGMAAAGSTITRTADFTLTSRSGSYTVSAPNGGQRVTRSASGYTYSVGGMRRVLQGSAGRTVVDISTRTTADINVTGNSRAERVMNGGTLELTHNLAGYTTTLSPSNVRWSASCTCPVSGTLSGTVAGTNAAKNFSVEFTGCGTATVTVDGETEEVELDRCGTF